MATWFFYITGSFTLISTLISIVKPDLQISFQALSSLSFEYKILLAFFSLILIVSGRLSRFKKVKILGFEAELWDDTKEEAEKLIQKFKHLSLKLYEPLIRFAVDSTGRNDRAIYNEEELYYFYNQSFDSLKALEIEIEKIEKVLLPIRRKIIWLILKDISLQGQKHLDEIFENKSHDYNLKGILQNYFLNTEDDLAVNFVDIRDFTRDKVGIDDDKTINELLHRLRLLLKKYKTYFKENLI